MDIFNQLITNHVDVTIEHEPLSGYTKIYLRKGNMSKFITVNPYGYDKRFLIKTIKSVIGKNFEK